ncbi:gamma-glutamyltransferase [Agaribacterium haliotis]|uniref:gamma-glutamyltransferase n=1 Tax=Agaribacterium haliotis TaxID=2013869 RepID=UPI000BB55620|nr:gamma-glutamyltransferase [Agaribacterium haliotis]
MFRRLSRRCFVYVSCVFCLPALLIAASLHADELGYARISDDGKLALASVQPLATEAGMDMYRRGGNAVDAALAMAFSLGVVDSHNSGIGGGLFIIARLADGRVLAIDGREMAPKLASRDMYLRDGVFHSELSKTGALAVGIPGSVQALAELQRLGGKLSLAETLKPAIDVAEQGFAIDHVLAARLQRSKNKLQRFPEAAAIFLPKGQTLKAGDTLVQKDLAQTYKKLAKQGPEYFYRGDFAKQTAKWMQANGGLISEADFKAYHTVRREPVRDMFLGYELIGFPPPSSGGTHVAQILKMTQMLGAYQAPPEQRYHLYIEASKLAFADRAHWMGDSDFVAVPKGLTDRNYLLERIALVNKKAANDNYSYGTPKDWQDNIFDKHTTHLVAADKQGNWVSITTTLNTSFGSGVVIPGTGVLMNNQMDDFAAQPGVANAFGLIGADANAIAPGKRPLSSMSPTLVMKDGKPLMALGAAGGPTIISQVAQVIQNSLAFGMTLDQAMLTPRVHHQWKPNLVFIDSYASEQLKKSLEAKGHKLRNWPPFGSTQALMLRDGTFQAEAEPRIRPGFQRRIETLVKNQEPIGSR